MKIAFISFYSGHVPRGVEVLADELATRLAKNNKVTVFQAGPAKDKAKYKIVVVPLDVDWAHPETKNEISRRLGLDYWSLKVKKFTQKVLSGIDKDTEIIFCLNGEWAVLLCRLWSLQHKAKLVVGGFSGPGWTDRLNLLFHPDAFIALTDFQKKWAKKNSMGVRVEKIPNGVDLSVFNPDVKSIKTNLSRPIFLCVAAFEKNKKIDKTIRAVARVGKGSLLLVGVGSLEKELQDLGEKLLSGRFLMAKAFDDRVKYYAACDVFTMTPISTESFGMVYLEAMATGKPVVATDDPIRREIIGEAGLFVDPENTEEYAVTLQKALDTNWGNKPRTQAEKFSWDKIVNQYEKLFY